MVKNPKTLQEISPNYFDAKSKFIWTAKMPVESKS